MFLLYVTTVAQEALAKITQANDELGQQFAIHLVEPDSVPFTQAALGTLHVNCLRMKALIITRFRNFREPAETSLNS